MSTPISLARVLTYDLGEGNLVASEQAGNDMVSIDLGLYADVRVYSRVPQMLLSGAND